MSEKFYRTVSVYIASYLVLVTGIDPIYEKKNQKIIFAFPSTDDTYRALKFYQEGQQVTASKYADVLKRVRAEMIQAKERPE